MLTFIFLFAGVIVLAAAFVIANAAGKRKRSGMAGKSQVVAQQETGGGSAPTGRASGTD